MSGFDADRVRVEFGTAMAVVREDVDGLCRWNMQPIEVAEIWLTVDGKIKRGKPLATLQDETRAGVMRQLADWVEQNDDPSLRRLVERIRELRGASS